MHASAGGSLPGEPAQGRGAWDLSPSQTAAEGTTEDGRDGSSQEALSSLQVLKCQWGIECNVQEILKVAIEHATQHRSL